MAVFEWKGLCFSGPMRGPAPTGGAGSGPHSSLRSWDERYARGPSPACSHREGQE